MKMIKWLLPLTASIFVISAVVLGISNAVPSASNRTIKITQIIQQRAAASQGLTDSSNLITFADGKPLRPAQYVGNVSYAKSPQVWQSGESDPLFSDEIKGAVDKFVSVRNDGNVDAYLRTWFAFEMGDLDRDEFEAYIKINRNESAWRWGEFEYGVMIEGERYAIVMAEYREALGAGQMTSHPSLLQVMLIKSASDALADRIDGNGNGCYEIKTHTRGVSDPSAWGSGELSHPWGS